MPGRTRTSSRTRDMVISMAVLLIPVFLIVALFTVPAEPHRPTANVASTLQKARAQSPYPLLVPERLGKGWTATRVAWARQGQRWITGEPATANSWQVGYLSPEGIYYGVQQRDAGASEFIAAVTREGLTIDGDVSASGRTWKRYESPDGRTRSLVNRHGRTVSIVTADTGFADLEAFASSLKAVEAGESP